MKLLWLKLAILALFVMRPTIALTQEMKHGTAMAAIRTPNEIVVAADSKVVHGDDSPDPDPLCKIRQIGDMFFAVHGMAEDTPSGFNVFPIIIKSGQQGGTISDRIAIFENLAKAPLEEALERLRVQKPIVYQRNCIDIAPLGVIFFGFESNELVFYYRRFVVNPHAGPPVSVNIERRGCPGPDCPTGIAAVFVGPTEHVQRFMRNTPEYWKRNLIDVARSFVQMEIDEKLVDVGPPIDILRITQAGATWEQRKQECPDIQAYAQDNPPDPHLSAPPAITASSTPGANKLYLVLAITIGGLLLGLMFFFLIGKKKKH